MVSLEDKQSAYGKVRRAIKNGIIRRANYCSRCGSPDIKGTDGRSTIHAHHIAGYENPLIVEWLCAKCHRKETPFPENRNIAPMPGSMNGNSKLNELQVIEILESDLSSRILGKKYGVAKSVILGIKRGERWRHVRRDRIGELK